MSKIQVFGHFLGYCSLNVSNFCMMVEGSRGHHLSVVPYLGQIIIPGLRGIKCKKFGCFRHFRRNLSLKVSIFCMMVEGNRGHHLSVVPYLGKILIQV